MTQENWHYRLKEFEQSCETALKAFGAGTIGEQVHCANERAKVALRIIADIEAITKERNDLRECLSLAMLSEHWYESPHSSAKMKKWVAEATKLLSDSTVTRAELPREETCTQYTKKEEK